jgi:hypothetical protein
MLLVAEPVHKYHSSLWEENAKNIFYEVCHYVIIPLHRISSDVILLAFPIP